MAQGAKLNIGCGLNVAPGFDNIDNSPSVFLARHLRLKWLLYKLRVISEHHYRTAWPTNIIWRNAVRGLPYPSQSVEKIYSSHFLEHVPYPKGVRVLQECRRVLKPGAWFRLSVPDLLYYGKKYVRETDHLVDSGEAGRGPHDAFLDALYGQYLTGHRAGHCYMYDWPTLRVLLPELGFKDVARREFRDSADPELGALDSRPEDSLIVEMTV